MAGTAAHKADICALQVPIAETQTQVGQPVALVTGASQGIGRSLAEEFAAHRHNILMVARDGERLRLVADDIRSRFDVDVHCLALDVMQPDAPNEILDYARASRLNIDTLVLNAAVWSEGTIQKLPVGTLGQVVNANIVSVCELAKAVLPSMIDRKNGDILFVGSLAGNVPSPNNAIYSATKAFLKSFALSLRAECAPDGVNVSLLTPGAVDTGFTSSGTGNRGFHDRRRRLFAATPETVAWVAYRALKSRQAIIVPSLFARTLEFGTKLIHPAAIASLRHTFARSQVSS